MREIRDNGFPPYEAEMRRLMDSEELNIRRAALLELIHDASEDQDTYRLGLYQEALARLESTAKPAPPEPMARPALPESPREYPRRKLILAGGVLAAVLTMSAGQGPATESYDFAGERPQSPYTPTSEIWVTWSGTVMRRVVDSANSTHAVFQREGRVSSPAIEEFRRWQESIYSDERLDSGAILFDEDISAKTCVGQVAREGGGWSYQHEASKTLCRKIVEAVLADDTPS